MRIFKRIALLFLVLLVWTAFVGLGFMNGYLLRPITGDDSPQGFIAAVEEHLNTVYVGNVALLMIEDGAVSESFFYSADQPVTETSVFPVASISKWVTSFGVMKLVEQGKLDLDAPVESYLTRWHLPESEFEHDKVTIRRLLSHSSGLVDDCGYAGFAADEPVQTLEESLTKAADGPDYAGEARVGYEPGSQYVYSGAAYTLLQLVMEEVSGLPFTDFMDQEVLQPLGMEHSTFDYSATSQFSKALVYQVDGRIREPKRFTALAAAGLYTCTADLGKFLLANLSDPSVLNPSTLQTMATAETFINQVGVYGLGPHLYSQNDANSQIIGHDGSGNNAINTAARVDLMSRSGIIILETGHYDLASSLADEWLFWKAGVYDFVVMTRNRSYLLTLLVSGYVVLLLGFGLVLVRSRKK